jgi:alpha-tubulin suppressor-like RCC1 family protein
MVILLDRSAALARDSRWSVAVEALRVRLGVREIAGRFGVREFPAGGCQAGALPALGDADLGALQPPGMNTARPLGDALDGLDDLLSGDAHGREVLVLTGGGETCSGEEVPLARVSALHRAGVRVHVVLLDAGSPARPFLDRLAEAGGTGQARVASTFAEVEAALDAIFAPLCEDPTAQVDAGYYHACRRNPGGEVQCWGRDLSGESTVPAGTYRQVSAGTDFTCAVTTAGALRCWGRNQFRQTQAPAGVDYVAVSAGNGHACALRVSGEIACWGRNEDGQGSPPDDGPFRAVASGPFYTCGVRATDGTIECWGHGRPRFPADNFTQLSAGSGHACALDPNQRAVCEGSNSFGESDPPPSPRFVDIAAGDDHTCGVRPDGQVECWGSDVFGESSPPDARFRSVSADNDYTCGVTRAGRTVCWGSGSNGQTTPPP